MEISNHPYANELRILFEMDLADLSANVKAIERFKGDLEQATNYLLE
jgi:hypothetical protein